MKKVSILLIVLFFFSCKNQTEEIPITSTSDEAISSYKLAKKLEGQLKTDEAEIQYKKALSIDSTFVLAHIGVAMLRDDFKTRRAHISKAMEYIDQISEGEKLWLLGRNRFYGTQKGEDEYTYFKELVNLYPEDENANYLFGFVNVHHGKTEVDTAITYFKKALELNPKVSKYYNELAYAHLLNQDFENAEKIISSYMNFLPDHQNPKETYAEMLMRNHRYQESLNAYTEVLEINPKAPWALMGSSTNLSFLGRYTEARGVLDKLGHIPLSDYEYRHKWRASICSYLIEGKIDSAISTLQQQYGESASGINQREPIFHQYIALSRRTRLYFENNQPEKGLKSYQDFKTFVIGNITNTATINSVLGLENYYQAYSNYLKGDYQKAQMLLENESNLSEDLNLLKAKILLRENEFKKAIAILENLDENNPYHLFWLAKAYKLNNQTEPYEFTSEQIYSKIEVNNLDYALIINRLGLN